MKLRYTASILIVLLLLLIKAAIISPAIFCLLVVVLMLASLVSEAFPPELSMGISLGVLLTGSFIHGGENGFLNNSNAFSGFSNEAVITVAVLFIVAAAVRSSGIFDVLAQKTLGESQNVSTAILRMAAPLGGLSALFNNTPIVAIFMPIVKEWANKHNISPSKLLIPLSYLTAFGGICTLIGTSTNLVIQGLFVEKGYQGFGLFEFAKVALPCGLISILYLAFIGSKILPAKEDTLSEASSNIKKYLIQMNVEATGPLVGKSVHEAGLRDLEDLFLIEIQRKGKVIAPIKREMILEEKDELVFSSAQQRIMDLHRVEGLSIATSCDHFELGALSNLIEVVVAPNSAMRGKTIDEVYFNRKYDATVLTLHRDGHQIMEKMSSTPLKKGDTLLLLAGFGFKKIWKDSKDFLSVTKIEEENEHEINSSPALCIATVAFMVGLPAFGIMPIMYTSIIAAAILVLYQYLPLRNAFSNVDWNVIIVIACSFGISKALAASGASGMVSQLFTTLSSPLLALIGIYIVTNILTELITNNAAAILMFEIALATAEKFIMDPTPFVISLAIAASASFATPIGYQTNTIVYGPGGYKYTDYIKVGLPINIIYLIGTAILVPLIWPLAAHVAPVVGK
ncbi:MAG: SLC13 family permease [Lentisphaerales bacterium]|nr:SLC13 family permease [Lentisphaerales bacterium]